MVHTCIYVYLFICLFICVSAYIYIYIYIHGPYCTYIHITSLEADSTLLEALWGAQNFQVQLWGMHLLFWHSDPCGMNAHVQRALEMGYFTNMKSHVSHESLDKRSQVFPVRPRKAQQPIIAPSRPYWLALAPLP